MFPLVVYQGKKPWTAPLCFSGIVNAPEEVRGHLLDFAFGLLDLGVVVLPARIRKQIAEAGPAELKTWLNRAVDAVTLDAVFAPSAKH